jgi:hypothetical protein
LFGIAVRTVWAYLRITKSDLVSAKSPSPRREVPFPYCAIAIVLGQFFIGPNRGGCSIDDPHRLHSAGCSAWLSSFMTHR